MSPAADPGSLLATRLVARIHDLLRVPFSVLSLFDEAPTVEQMAAMRLQGKSAPDATMLLWLSPVAWASERVDQWVAA